MKNVIISTILFLLVLHILNMNKNRNELLKVFNDNNTYKSYIIDLSIDSITTHNIRNYIFDEIDALYPYFDNGYNNINTSWYNIDKTRPFESNIKLFEEKYINYFNNNSKKDYAISIKLEGIRISKAIVITDSIERYKKYSYVNLSGINR